jgi:dipeptidyl aminopeptidase/acylaminoacyl peptidase
VFHLSFTSEDISPQFVGTLLKNQSMIEDYIPPQLFNFTSSDGVELHGMVFKPHLDGMFLNTGDGTKYPTVLFVYGGPRSQLINNTFKGLRSAVSSVYSLQL